MLKAQAAYCDYNAGAPLRPVAFEALARVARQAGNPSSIHASGRAMQAVLEASREAIAARIGAQAGNLVFTSGATEGLHWVLEAAREGGARSLVLSAIEHDALAEQANLSFAETFTLPVSASGLVDPLALDAILSASPAPALVAVMAANNETGAIQPLRAIAPIVRRHGGFLLVDAAQAPGRIVLDMQAWDASYVVLSSHKLGGPPGAGVVALAPGAPLGQVRAGGGQERGRRPGTPNVPAIAGFSAALEEADDDLSHEAARLADLRDTFEAALKTAFPDAVVFAASAPRLPNTSLFAIPGWRAETALIALDLSGVAASSGAACSSGKVRKSRVLAAMGVPDPLAACAIRISLGWATPPTVLEHLTTTVIAEGTKARARAAAKVE